MHPTCGTHRNNNALAPNLKPIFFARCRGAGRLRTVLRANCVGYEKASLCEYSCMNCLTAAGLKIYTAFYFYAAFGFCSRAFKLASLSCGVTSAS